jgi:hypothetical protein
MEKNKYLTQQPWQDYNAWKSCYDMLFGNIYGKKTNTKMNKLEENLDSFINRLEVSDLRTAFKLLKIWNTRGDSNNVILTTILLVEEIVKFKTDVYGSNDVSNDKRHILAQKIIRVTNLIIDEIRKKSKSNGNMFLIAKEVDFPEFIIEIRHSCTHKNLPKDNILIFTIKYLYYWIKEHLWDKQYMLFQKEITLYETICEVVRSLSSVDRKLAELDNIISDYGVKIELKHLKNISELFVKKFMDSCKLISKKAVICDKQNEFEKIYQFLQVAEERVITLYLYLIICEEIYFIVKNLINGDKSANDFETQLASLSHLSKFLSKTINKRKSEMDSTVLSIQKRLFFSKDFSSYINEIYNNFTLAFKDEIKQINQVNFDLTEDSISPQNVVLGKDTAGSLLFKQLNGITNKSINLQYGQNNIKKVPQEFNSFDYDLVLENCEIDDTFVNLENTLIL